MKNNLVTISGTEDSNESHPTVTEDDNEDDDEEDDDEDDLNMKPSEKEDNSHSQSNTPRKSNRRAEKPPCSYLLISFFRRISLKNDLLL